MVHFNTTAGTLANSIRAVEVVYLASFIEEAAIEIMVTFRAGLPLVGTSVARRWGILPRDLRLSASQAPLGWAGLHSPSV